MVEDYNAYIKYTAEDNFGTAGKKEKEEDNPLID